MIAIVDNYDSFVFNVARYFHRLGETTKIIRNNRLSLSDLVDLRPRAVVISPGPSPSEAGISTAVIRELSGRVPILGICLGHQCIGSVFGGRVARAHRPMHGRSSEVTHGSRGLFKGLPSPASRAPPFPSLSSIGHARRILWRQPVRTKARSWLSHIAISQHMAFNSTRNRS